MSAIIHTEALSAATLRKLEAQEIFAGAQKRCVQLGNTLRVWLGTPEEIAQAEPEVQKEISRALARGLTVVEDGVSRWMRTQEVPGLGYEGSDRYIWHPDGEKIRVERFIVTKQADGTMSERSIGFAWKFWRD